MTAEEQLGQLEQENRHLKEQLAQRDELIESLTQRLAALEEQMRKNSRTRSLPPSSDRFVRQPKSLRKKSGKKAGGHPGHPGHNLQWSQTPDEVMLHALASCPHCHGDLQTVLPVGYQRRQVVDVPAVRLIVQAHQAECKQCPGASSEAARLSPRESEPRCSTDRGVGPDRSIWWSNNSCLGGESAKCWPTCWASR